MHMPWRRPARPPEPLERFDSTQPGASRRSDLDRSKIDASIYRWRSAGGALDLAARAAGRRFEWSKSQGIQSPDCVSPLINYEFHSGRGIYLVSIHFAGNELRRAL